MNWVKRKILLAMAVLVVAPLVAAVLPPAAAQAIDGGSALWVDKENIRYPNNGASATDGDPYIKNGDNYFRQGDLKNLCSDDNPSASNNANTYAKFYQDNTQIHVITNFSNGDSHAIYRVLNIKLYERSVDGRYTEVQANQTKITNGKIAMKDSQDFAFYGCKKAQADSQIVLQQAQHATEGYHWVSKTQIETSDASNRLYTLNDAGNYVWQGDSNTCQEYLEVAPSSASGTLHYNGQKNGGNQCQWSTKSVGISQTENATVDPAAASADPSSCDQDCQSERNCTQESKPFSWLVCPTIRFINKILDFLFNKIILPLLKVEPLNTTKGSCDAGSINCTYKVWTKFRDLANAALVLVFLLIIFANVASIKIDSYTVKKLLPKLVAAAVLIQFSFVFSSLLVDMGNVFGAGVKGIIDVALQGTGNSTQVASSAGQDILSGLMVGGGIAVAFVSFGIIAGPTLLLMLLGLLVGTITLLITLVVRQIAITMLVVLSPIAIMLWVLPNTEKYFKDWLENFTKLVLMYPIIMLIVGSGRIVEAASGDGTALGTQFIGLLAPTISLLMIPAAFKFAGAILQRGAGLVGGKGQGLLGGVKSSQAVRDLKARQGITNANRAAGYGFGNNKVTRKLSTAVGRLGTGQVLPGVRTQQAIARGFGQSVGQESKNLESLNLPTNVAKALSMGDTKELERLGRKDLVPLTKNAASRAAAGAMVAKNSVDDFEEIRLGIGKQVAAKQITSSQAEQLWNSMLQPNFGAVYEKDPLLALGGWEGKGDAVAVASSLSSEGLSKLKPKAIDRLIAAGGAAGLRQSAIAGVTSGASGARLNPELSSKIFTAAMSSGKPEVAREAIFQFEARDAAGKITYDPTKVETVETRQADTKAIRIAYDTNKNGYKTQFDRAVATGSRIPPPPK